LFITINETDLPSNFLSYLLEFTRNNWQYEQRNQVINNILSLIKIFSKIPMIIHSQWPNACIPWLKKIGSRPSYTTDFLINLILQKLARHTIAIEILNCTKILIEKILCALSKLFINDNILKKCLNENNQLLDCLCQLLIQYSIITSNTIQIHQLLNDETLIILTNLLWSISFHESYQEKLKLNINFIHTLSNLATSSL
ncbi:unnamed protein product, partial [Rotaria sp. Silwood1]